MTAQATEAPPPLAPPVEPTPRHEAEPEEPTTTTGPRIPAGPVGLIGAELAGVAGIETVRLLGPDGAVAAAAIAAGGIGWAAYRMTSLGRRRARTRLRSAVGSRSAGSGPAGGRGTRGSSSPSRRRGGALPRLSPGGRAGGRTAGRSPALSGRQGRRVAPPSWPTGKKGRPAGGRAAAARMGSIDRPASAASRRAARVAHRAAGAGKLAERAANAGRAAHKTTRAGGSLREAAKAARAAGARPVRGHLLRRASGAAAATVLGLLWAAICKSGAWAVSKLRGRRPEIEAEPEPPIADTVNRPEQPGQSAHREDPTMSSSDRRNKQGDRALPAFIEAANEFAEALRSYTPPDDAGGMMEFLDDVEQLPDALAEVADGWRVMAEHAGSDWPLNQHISEMIAAIAKVQDQMAGDAQEIGPAIRVLHVHDVERHEEPRPGEHTWNVA